MDPNYTLHAYQIGVGRHWWFNYPGPLLNLSLSLPVYQVRLDWLSSSCIALIQPSQLSCLCSSVGRATASLSSMSWVRTPPGQLFFHFPWKKRCSRQSYRVYQFPYKSSHTHVHHCPQPAPHRQQTPGTPQREQWPG